MRTVRKRVCATMLCVLLSLLLLPGMAARAQEGTSSKVDEPAVADVGDSPSMQNEESVSTSAAAEQDLGDADELSSSERPDVLVQSNEDEGLPADSAMSPEDSTEAMVEDDVPTSGEVVAESAAAHVSYRTHVQNVGWQDWKSDGQMSGTSGHSLRLEGINIKLDNPPRAGGIEYRTHVQNVGWQDWKSDGQMSGTSRQSKRLEAIQIRLTGDMAQRYDVWYHVHAQDFGWMGWTKNGSRAGTATYSKRLEAIEIFVLPKGSPAPGSTANPYATRAIMYRTHVQNYGWQDWVYDGALSGTSGKSRRLEGIYIGLCDAQYPGGIRYRTHVQDIGWQGWRSGGQMSGTTGRSKRLEAIQVGLTGEMADHYDVWYRVHAQNVGWMGWASNEEEAGTAGYSRRLEAIQIVLVPKGASSPSTSFGGIVQATDRAFLASTGSTGQSAPTISRVTTRGLSSAGALRVSGNRLVDGGGNAVQLTGISTHGLAWFPQYVNDGCFKQLRNEWNANVVRLAMYTEEYGGYCSGGNKTELKELVKKGVRLATQNDLYVIVDWHILSDGNPNRHVAEAKDFFKDMSTTFAGNDNVIYEICNEPNGGTSWDEIKAYANQVIPVIRQNDANAIVIVGTPTWSQEVDKAAASPLNYENVMYALHFYAATHKDDLRDRMVRAVRGGLPVFVSEFGICDASGNGSIDEASANSWITTMDSLGVSWCMWSLCNKAESASAIKSNCGLSSGFRTGDLATSGLWLLKALNGTLPAGEDRSTVADTTNNGGGQTPSTVRPVTFTSGSFACTATLTNSWPAGGGKTCYQYDLSITNKGASCSSWKVSIPFNKAITLANGWNGVCSVSGSRLNISSMDYNGSIAKGATISGIGFQVTSDTGLEVRR